MISVSKLTKVYGPRAAVNELSFEIKKGEVVGFLGPNGAGKSTTMKIITGYMPASSGKVSVADFDVFENPLEVKKRVGFLPETPPVYPEMQVQAYLEFAGRLHQVPRSKIKAAVSDVIGRTGLGDVRARLIGNLSKGYRQRVGLAQALVHNPAVLILDEPTVGLDPKQIIEIRQLIKSLKGDHTVILSSHILPEVTATCDRIIVISKGQIVAQDNIDRLTARAKKSLVYHLEVQETHAAGLDAIRALSGVHHLSQAGKIITVEIQPGTPEIRPEILKKAVEHQLGVLEFSSEKVSLEEVFLELTTVEKT